MAGSSRRVFERSLFAGTRAGTQRMMEWPRFGKIKQQYACVFCLLCQHYARCFCLPIML